VSSPGVIETRGYKTTMPRSVARARIREDVDRHNMGMRDRMYLAHLAFLGTVWIESYLHL
jgi:hypothetical protein